MLADGNIDLVLIIFIIASMSYLYGVVLAFLVHYGVTTQFLFK